MWAFRCKVTIISHRDGVNIHWNFCILKRHEVFWVETTDYWSLGHWRHLLHEEYMKSHNIFNWKGNHGLHAKLRISTQCRRKNILNFDCKATDNWLSGPHESLGAILKSRGVGQVKKYLKMLLLFFESA